MDGTDPRWRKPRRSFSNGNCCEVGEDWRKAERSIGNGDCLEAASGVLVRDTKDREGAVLRFTPAAWTAFTRSLRDAPGT